MAENENVQWTAKAPALVGGLMLVIAGIVALYRKRKYATIGGILLVLAGVGFFGWSLTIKEWCAARDIPHSAFASAFGGSFHSCLHQKGWLEF